MIRILAMALSPHVNQEHPDCNVCVCHRKCKEIKSDNALIIGIRPYYAYNVVSRTVPCSKEQ